MSISVKSGKVDVQALKESIAAELKAEAEKLETEKAEALKAEREARAKAESDASRRLMVAVNTYSDAISSATKLAGRDRLGTLALNKGSIAESLKNLDTFLSVAADAVAEIRVIAHDFPGSCTTLFNGDQPVWNPAVKNPANDKGANSWPPSAVLMMVNRAGLTALHKLRSTVKA